MALFDPPPPWRNQVEAPLLWNPVNEGLSNWFRRTGVYSACLNGQKIYPAKVAASLIDCTARHCAEESVTYMALLDGVAFAKDSMDFGTFRVWRPAAQELEKLLEVKTNGLFPRAISSTDGFADVWYILVRQTTRRPPTAGESTGEDRSVMKNRVIDDSALEAKFSTFPTILKRALRCLLLWPRWKWLAAQQCSDEDVPERPFRIPFFLTICDCPFERPVATPARGIYYYQPLPPARFMPFLWGEEWSEEAPEGWEEWVSEHPEHAQEGCSIRDTSSWRLQPAQPWEIEPFDEKLTVEFEALVKAQVTRLTAVRPVAEWWQFINLALDFLVKGHESEGLESLLWYVVALESLLGDREHATKDIARRLDTLLGPIPLPEAGRIGPQQSPKKLFDELYEFRCALVHGREAKERARKEHILLAYRLTALALAKVIELLSGIAARVHDNVLPEMPPRADILEGIDRVARGKSGALHPVAHAIREILRR
jgi:hypothetical protein